ncbi:MAG: pyridoxamine 5'-phosphate oxidase family protein [Bacteroidota bacterium]
MDYKSERSRVRRVAKRGHYDPETVHAVLDASFVGQVSFQVDEQPFQIPMLYGRRGNVLYLHGSPKSRIYQVLSQGVPCCLGVTLVDGLVLARSAFHHSVNYRSVVIFGTCRPVEDPKEKMAAFALFTEAIIPGRWQECRPMKEKEAAVTGILALKIEDASAKIRTGGPIDEEEDYALPIWAGVVPLKPTYGKPVADEQRSGDYPLPTSVKKILATE